jgi:hypothetical protein
MNRGCLQSVGLNNPQQLPAPHPKLRITHQYQVRRFNTEPYVESCIGGVQGPLAISYLAPTKLDKTHETVSSAASEASHRHGKRECDVNSLQIFTTHSSRMLYRAKRQKASVQLRASPPEIESTTGLHTSLPRLAPHRHQSCHVCSHPISCIFPNCLTSHPPQCRNCLQRITTSHGFSLSALFWQSKSS